MSFVNGRGGRKSLSFRAFQASPTVSHRRSTSRRDRWRQELTPFVTCGRLRGAKCLSGFCAATGEMDERPSHRERRESVALRGAEQLMKRCVRRAPAKADQNAEGGIEDASALHVERELGGNPVSRHALLTSCGASTDARHRHGPNHCHDLCQSSGVARRSPTSRCICDHLGTEACRRRRASTSAVSFTTFTKRSGCTSSGRLVGA
jgi:hypothetical protein